MLPEWREDRHPQETLPRVEDPVALYRPSPEVIAAPTAPVLAVVLVGVNPQLTWDPSESGITEIKSYDIYRGVDGATPTLLINCPVRRDFLGGIKSIDHCTIVSPPEHPDDPWTTVIEDSPVTYLDTTAPIGHTYCYFVIANPLGNNQSTAQGPPSAPSNTACATPVNLAVQLYSAWSAFTTITTPAAYVPGLAAVQAALPKPFLVVIGQLISGDNPQFQYGGTSPVASLGAANGAAWMAVFDLTLNPPASNLLSVIGNGQTDYSAAVFYGVNSFLTHTSGYFPGSPFADAWGTVVTGSCLVAMAKGVNGATPGITSNDAAALTSILSGNPFNNGRVDGAFQFPTNAAVTLTSTSAPGPLVNAVSCQLSP